jgi:nucleoside-diphosphate-sugar epimerase
MIKENQHLTVLITGANGFMGTNLIHLLYSDPNVIIRAMILPNTPTNVLESFATEFSAVKEIDGKKKFEIVYADMLNLESVTAAVKDIDVIVHLAGIVTDWAPEKVFNKIIIDGTRNLLLAARNAEVKRFIYMSSLTVSNLNGHTYDDETAPRDMKFFKYGVAKIEGENLVESWASENENIRDYAIIRPGFIIYGEYDVNSFVNVLDAIRKGTFGLINKGKALISYIYVHNLVYGIQLLIHSATVHGPYIILDGNITWKDWVMTWAKAANCKAPTMSVPYALIFPITGLMEIVYKLFRIKKSPPLTLYRIRIPHKDLAFKSDKIIRECGYKPLVDFDTSIKLTMENYKKIRHLS